MPFPANAADPRKSEVGVGSARECGFRNQRRRFGRKALFLEPDAIQFTIIQEEKSLGQWMGKSPGVLKPKFTWNAED